MSNNIVVCEVEKCIHNMNNMCSAQWINIVGQNAQHLSQTNCQTFELRTFRSSITNMTNINITGAVDQIFTEEPVMNPIIKCNVTECVYNSMPACNAPYVTIGDYYATAFQETKCKTFEKR